MPALWDQRGSVEEQRCPFCDGSFAEVLRTCVACKRTLPIDEFRRENNPERVQKRCSRCRAFAREYAQRRKEWDDMHPREEGESEDERAERLVAMRFMR
jgi:hypothetical protein